MRKEALLVDYLANKGSPREKRASMLRANSIIKGLDQALSAQYEHGDRFLSLILPKAFEWIEQRPEEIDFVGEDLLPLRGEGVFYQIF